MLSAGALSQCSLSLTPDTLIVSPCALKTRALLNLGASPSIPRGTSADPPAHPTRTPEGLAFKGLPRERRPTRQGLRLLALPGAQSRSRRDPLTRDGSIFDAKTVFVALAVWAKRTATVASRSGRRNELLCVRTQFVFRVHEMRSTTAKLNIIFSNSGEIWYLTFERINDYGSGLATYIRNVAAAVRQEMRPIRIFQVARGAHTVTRAVEAGVNICQRSRRYVTRNGVAWLLDEPVLAVRQNCLLRDRPARCTARHRSPRRFRARIFLISAQTGRRSSPAIVPLILVAHTPIGVSDEWIGANLFALPNWWTYRAEKWCFRAADAVITLSSILEKELFDKGYLLSGTRIWRSVNPYNRPNMPRAAQEQQTRTILLPLAWRRG